MYFNKIPIVLALILTTDCFENPLVVRQLDEAGLVIAPKLHFEGDQTALKVAKIGEKFELHCEAFGQPAPVVYWTRNGEPVSSYDEPPHANVLEKFRNVGIRTYQIGNTIAIHQIPCVTAADAGIYTCVAENGHEILKRDVELIADGENKPSKFEFFSSGTNGFFKFSNQIFLAKRMS